MTTNPTIEGVLVSRELIERVTNPFGDVHDKFNAVQELRALLDAPYPPEAQLIAAGLGYPMSKEDAVKAYKASLVPRTDSPANADCEWCHGCGHDPYGEPCVGCCAPAAQPQGEPVARVEIGADRDAVLTITDDNWLRSLKARGIHQIVPLYAEQPAPVAVVMPERRVVPSPDLDAYKPVDAASWNACLDEVTRLNSKSP